MGLFGRLFGKDGDETPTGGEAGGTLHEASMNFDLEHVRPFLERLRDRRGIGFDVEAMARFTAETPVETERDMSADAMFRDREATVRYSVFMDDIDAPDLYFFSSDKELIDAINEEWGPFTEELGI